MDGSTFFKSEVSLASASFNDDGIYTVVVQVMDAEGNERLAEELQTEVVIHGELSIITLLITLLIASF